MEALRDRLVREVGPQTLLEELAVGELADAEWRSRRAQLAERGLFERVFFERIARGASSQARALEVSPVDHILEKLGPDVVEVRDVGAFEEARARQSEAEEGLGLPSVIASDAIERRERAFSLLLRYEASIRRSRDRALKVLLGLLERRMPAATDEE